MPDLSTAGAATASAVAIEQRPPRTASASSSNHLSRPRSAVLHGPPERRGHSRYSGSRPESAVGAQQSSQAAGSRPQSAVTEVQNGRIAPLQQETSGHHTLRRRPTSSSLSRLGGRG